METPAQMLLRLLAAFEDLVAQEALLLQTDNYAAVLEMQDRTAPLVSRLIELAKVADAAARDRLAGVLMRRQRSQDLLSKQIARIREELNEIRSSQRRVAQIAPVYGRSGGGSPRLSAVG